ncbi:MAG: hypothetical protein ABI623_08020 [bacterium]
MKTFIVVLSGLLFSSCMHVGMMGTGGHSDATHETTEPVLQKEVIVGDIRATATFPPLQMQQNVTVSLRLVDARTSQPISGAKVYLHAQYAHKLDPNTSHDHSGPSRSGSPESEHDVNIDQEVEESREPGVYSILYGSSQWGEHTLMFHIAAIGERQFEPEIIIEGKRMLMQQSHEHSSGMMGMSSTTTYIVVGAVAMGAIMTAVLLTHRGMY